MKTTVAARRIKHNGQIRWRVCIPQALQGIHNATRRFYDNAEEAKAFAATLNQTRSGWATQLLTLAAPDQGRLVRILERVAWDLAALELAAEKWVKVAAQKTITLADAITRHVADKRNAAHSEKHTRELENVLTKFGASLEGKTVADITPQDIVTHLEGNGWGPTTRRNVYAKLRCLFESMKRAGYVEKNPCESITKPKGSTKVPQILQPGEVKKLLAACVQIDPGLVSYLALGIFSGIRPAEMLRMEPSDIQPDHIRLDPTKTKTRKRRIIETHPTLRAWLERYPEMEWRKQSQSQIGERIRIVRKAAGVTMPPDVMRHSFCSYGLPVWGAQKTSQFAGNTETVLMRDYRELVPPSSVPQFWSLTPDAITTPIPGSVAA